MPDELPPEVREAQRALQRLMSERSSVLDAARHAGRLEPGRLGDVDERIRDVLDRLRDRVGAVSASPDVPLVLLPVRLETRFGTRDGQAVLRVRVYPDDVHVDGLERGLTEQEYAAGQGWWHAAWAGGGSADAFAALVAAVGPARAEWVAHATTPLNLAGRGTTTVPSFPERVPPLGRGAVARGLPDRFVALAVQGGTVSRGVGQPVPPDLPLSPVPTLDGAAPPADGSRIAVAPGAQWLVDYDSALAVGMAVEVPLSGGIGRVDRLVILGTRGAADAGAGATELEDLLLGHRFGAGLGLLAQGSATNNTDEQRSPYRPRREPVAPPADVIPAGAGSDASALAGVLGVDATLLTGLVGHGSGEQALAGHVNTALWGAGWGSYLEELHDRGVPGTARSRRDQARRLFGAHVRGRGPAPALRVGAQPYGVLPASDVRRWTARSGEDGAGVAQVVGRLLDQWLWAARTKVPTVRPGQAGIDDTLLEVMGSSPVMQYLRVRPELDEGAAAAVGSSIGAPSELYRWEQWLTAAVASRLLGVDAGRLSLGSLHSEDRPLPLPLVSERDDEFVTALLASPSRVLEVDSVLQALVHLSWQHAEEEVAGASPVDLVPQVVELAGLDRRESEAVRTVLARADTADAGELFDVAGRLVDERTRDSAAALLSTYQPVHAVQTSLAEVALSGVEGNEAAGMATVVIGEWLARMAYRNELRSALRGLLGTDLQARRLAVAESLDLASHRLDAWATAVVSERRARELSGSPARGLTVGAYGVVEELDPRLAGSRGGWLHAPSPQHAAAAGMLRSAHLSHLGGEAGGGGPFALGLSSARARAADHVLQGVRAGQQLAALIGYRIERDLVSRGLGRIQLSLRTIAPLTARRLSDRPSAGAEPAAVQETVAATDVVDGLLLLHQHPPGSGALRDLLRVPPQNAYLPPSGWQPLSDQEWDELTQVLRDAADTVDAIADVLLAESVLQYAGGNPGRAAAAMDAMGEGGPVADALDVLEVPDSGERLTHEALVVVGAGAPSSPWDTSRPRAAAEPALEAWAATQLGRPHDVVVATPPSGPLTLADAGLAALDLVFTTDPVVLESVLRAALPDLAGVPLAWHREPSWDEDVASLGEVVAQAVSLRALVAGSQPLLPSHLVRTDTTPARDLAAALPELCTRVEALATGLAATVRALQPDVDGIPEGGVVADQATADALTEAIHDLDAYGIPLPAAHPDRPLDVAWVRSAWQSAQARATNAQASVERLRRKRADGEAPAALLEAAQDVATGVLGEGFTVLPVLPAAGAADPFVAALTAPAFPQPVASAVRRFVQDHGTVRTQLQRWSETRLLAGALGRGRPWTVAQLAGTDGGGPAPGTTRWLAGPLPPEGPWPDGPVTHLVLDVLGEVRADAAVAGLVVDTWVEDLPEQPAPGADPADPQPHRARTGLALRADAASARPPQAILCAVSPDGARWSEESVRAVVEGTLDLARARLVTLERLAGEARVLPALYTRHRSLQGSKYLSWLKLAEANVDYVAASFVKDG